MKKKLICFLFIIGVVFVAIGCDLSDDLFFEFVNISDQEYNIPPIRPHDEDNEIELFAKDLVVIPPEYKQDKDDIIKAKASLLINLESQEAIYANNVYEQLYPASLTKLATALVVLKHGELLDQVTISHNAANIEEVGAKLCGFKEGDVISLEALLSSLLVFSGNDAGIAIGEHISGSEKSFAELMNKEVEALGAVHSNFVNSHGLHDDQHISTAYDMYLIVNELIKYDKFIDIIGQAEYTATYKNWNNVEIEKTFKTTNEYLLGTHGVDESLVVVGGKTGRTKQAGNCLALLSEGKNSEKYITIILNAENNNEVYKQTSHLLLKTKQ